MDAVKFLEEKVRMCQSVKQCYDCPLDSSKTNISICCQDLLTDYPKEAVEAVEKWSNEHPMVTNGAKFVEVFGRYIYERPWEQEGWIEHEYKEPKGEQNEL